MGREARPHSGQALEYIFSRRGAKIPTLDAAFDSQDNKELIQAHHMKPVIYPNRRNAKTPIVIARMFRWFDRARSRLRCKVERTLGWQDTYRKLALSYDRLPEIRKGSRLLAYAMINFRVTFNTS